MLYLRAPAPDERLIFPSPEERKAQLMRIREESSRMTDNVTRKDVRQVALLGLTAKDVENLDALAEADGRVRNYAVLIRRLIAREAQALKGR